MCATLTLGHEGMTIVSSWPVQRYLQHLQRGQDMLVQVISDRSEGESNANTLQMLPIR